MTSLRNSGILPQAPVAAARLEAQTGSPRIMFAYKRDAHPGRGAAELPGTGVHRTGRFCLYRSPPEAGDGVGARDRTADTRVRCGYPATFFRIDPQRDAGLGSGDREGSRRAEWRQAVSDSSAYQFGIQAARSLGRDSRSDSVCIVEDSGRQRALGDRTGAFGKESAAEASEAGHQRQPRRGSAGLRVLHPTRHR